MSIKIYSGYKLADGVSTHQVLREVIAHVRPALIRRNYQELLEVTIEAFDAPQNDKPLYEVFREIIHEETFDKDNVGHCKNAQVVLFENQKRNEQYAIFFGLRCEEEFAALPSIAGEFGYWNNSDSYPEGVKSEKQWADRRTAWEETFDLREATSTQGLTISVLSDYDLRGFRTRDVVALKDELVLPSIEKRAANLARSLYMKEKMNRFAKGNDIIREFMEAMHNYADLTDKSEWVERASKLLKPVSFDLLLSDVKK